MKLNRNEQYLLFAQIGMILQAGYGIDQGFVMIAEELDEPKIKQLVLQLNEKRQHTATLSEAFAACEVFDDYAVHLIEVGEVSGNLDEVMLSLADYYQRLDAMSQSLTQALSYPIVLMIMMFAVVGVIVWKVLPIFQNVLRSLGSDLSSYAYTIMSFGRVFSMLAFLLLALGLILLAGFLLYAKRQKEDAATIFIETCIFTRKLRDARNLAQVTYALSMFLASGMDLCEALKYAGKLIKEGSLKTKIMTCIKDMEQGASFTEALGAAQIYHGMQMNMLRVAFASGKGEAVMQQLSVYYQEEVNKTTQHFLNVIEPSIVLLLAAIVGIVLLSIMLPLMSILSSL